MQLIYGAGNASNIAITAQKRLVRPVYAQTQGFPYAATLNAAMRDTNNNIVVPTTATTTPFSYSSGATFTFDNSIVPGTVMAKPNKTDETVAVHPGGSTVIPFGLLGQWLGGTFDNVGQNNQVGIWMGPDSTYDILQPAWDYTNISSAVSGASAGVEVFLKAGTNGLLTVESSAGTKTAVTVARVVAMLSNAVLRIQMLI